MDTESLDAPPDLKRKLFQVVCSINGFLEQLHANEDCYALGTTSNLIATELAKLSIAKNRRKSAARKISILFVDRTLDLANVVGHHLETLYDRALYLLERLPGQSNDVMVDMAPLCSSTATGR